MGVESDNFTAEMLLKQLGAQDGGHGTSASGAAVVMSALRTAGIPLGGVRVVDGSGLSQLNRLTAASLVTLLQAAWIDPDLRAAFLPVLPVAGVSGTLRHRLGKPPARGRVLAKTGTTNGASTLAGYVTGRYAFAVLHNGRPVSTWWARRAQDRFVTVLAASQ
jgi:PBP4 family serine-type D-alanyl-D-alanine carboxypeptidase